MYTYMCNIQGIIAIARAIFWCGVNEPRRMRSLTTKHFFLKISASYGAGEIAQTKL